MSEITNIPTEEKFNMHDKNHILSCLSFLEKIYEQSQNKSNQERLFRISKAINSIKKYSNCQVSSFNFKPSNKPMQTATETNTNSDSNLEPVEEDKNIENLLLFIEKELKENGINENDINNSNSLLSTSKKSFNSSDNKENIDNIEKLPSSMTEIIPSNNLNKKRLSKLFLKIELKLKTYIQENNMKKDLIKDNKENNENIMNEKNENKNYLIYTFGDKLSKSPSKLPNVIDSFFSDKNKVNSILKKVQKQRRKSVMDFNTKYCHLSKDEKEIEYINDSDNKDQKNNKRKKIIPCSANVVIRNKTTKNNTSGKVSNFFDMIDEKEEDKEDFEEINSFNNIIAEEHNNPNINIKDNNKNNNIFISEIPNNIINIQNDSSIKIASSLNNNKFIFNNEYNNNNNQVTKNENKNNSNNISVPIDDNDNYFYVSKTSVFNNENEHESNNNSLNNNNQCDSPLLDDELLMKSSCKKESNNSKEEKESIESSDSNKSENKNCDDEKYNMLKYINDSINRKSQNQSNEEESDKSVSNFGKNSSNENIKYSFQREIDRANNINRFCMNSILSPLKNANSNVNIDDNTGNCVIEEFSKFN
jgi:hypothetical protein